MMAGWVLDGILLAAFAAVVIAAAKRGFFACALQLGAWIVSIALASTLGDLLARPLYEIFAQNAARDMIARNIGTLPVGDAAQAAQKMFAALPEALVNLAAVARFSVAGLTEQLTAQQFTAQNAAALLEQTIVAPIAVTVFRLALRFVLFAALLFVTRAICRKIEKIKRLPVLKQADKLLGAGLGIVKGLLMLVVLALLLRAAAALRLGGDTMRLAVEGSRVATHLAFEI
ncbi:MAG: CvpA family protein [Oscillospiraceae bacterium]|nr:CvpA family protein [Oscillospiraceae bacterium]